MTFVGIDPGLSSAAIGAIDHNGKLVLCESIKQNGERICVYHLKELMRRCLADSMQIVVEDVFVMPGQGISSSGKFMRAAGMIEAVAMLTATTHLVRPQRWKKDMVLGKDKYACLEVARGMWPDAKLDKKKDHNKAEALLLAEWCRREFL